MRFLGLVLLVVAACSSAKKAPAGPTLSAAAAAWIADYQRVANDGCACVDAACVEAAHARGASIEAAHGGLDELPAEAYAVHGKLEACWEAHTADAPRDLEHLATAVCGCTDSTCFSKQLAALTAFHDKYGDDPGATPDEHERVAHFASVVAGCVADRTTTAAEYLGTLERAADATCACTDADCANGAMAAVIAIRGHKLLIVDADAGTDARRDRASARICKCMGEAVAHTVTGGLPTKVDMTCDFKL